MLQQLKHKMECTSKGNMFAKTLTHNYLRLLFFCSYILVTVKANDGYLVTHPMKLRPGAAERLSVTIFDPTEDIKVQARLFWKEEVIAETEKFIFGKGFLTLQVPGHIYGRAKVEICGNCELGATGFHFKNSTLVDVTDKSSSVFIQIDKPVYKPGQKVLINFILTGADLRPKDEKVVAYIKDPHGSRMMHWKRLKPLCCGIMNVTFPLSDQPVLGEWLIFAEIGTQLFNKTFEVKKYVLPRFEVLINPPKFIRNFSECATATVTARYTYGKPVEGKLSINMNLHGLGYYSPYVGQNKYMFMDISGTASFDICINKLLSAKLKPYFRGVVRIEASVTSNDGNAFTAIDESCSVHKLLVHLEFDKYLPKHFKPGLPYFGKVNVVYPDNSTADDITVRISAEVDQNILYTYDYISTDGVVEFDLPTLPVGVGLVWLNAQIIAIRGVDVTDIYESSVYQHLSSWYSPSHCHILLKNLQPDLKVGDTAMVGILSTCPCNFSYHYEVMSRGNIVSSGTHRAFHSYRRNQRNTEPLAELQHLDNVTHNVSLPEPVDHCETVFSFEVTHDMAPMSRLLVYYVLDNNEGVADAMTMDIEPAFENQVKVRLSRNETRPDQKLSMTVSAKPGSCVCFVAVDRSVQLLNPNYQITLDNVFEELRSYDISAEMHEATYWWNGVLHQRRRRSSPFPRSQRLRDAQYAFREAGLNVMTDKVQLGFLSSSEIDVDPISDPVQHRVGQHTRAYFPETWMWKCFNLSDTMKEQRIHIHAPDTISTWSIDFIALSKTYGLGVSKPTMLKTFKDFFVEMTLPYSVIRGEQLRVPITVYNYMEFCVQLNLVVHLQEGIEFIGETGPSHNMKLCIQAGETMTVHVVLVFSELGKKRIHASAEAHYSPDCCDGPVSEERVVAVDKITQNILVEAEGIPRGYAYSVFFCPNERIHISTPNRYEYQFVKKPSAMDYLTFLVKAKSDATIGLARNHDSHELYEIVLGGWDNKQSWIARSRMGDEVAVENTPDIVSWHEFRAFWITWDDGEIKVGHGEVPTNDSVILEWMDELEPLLPIEYIGYTTGMGSIGEFRIWRKEEDAEDYNEAFALTMPLNYVPGSERAVATIIGDVMGPTLNNLHNLIRLPFGCGEQNMIHFAPIVYVMDYLKRTRQLTTETEAEAKTFLVQGYQRQLTYKRYDGSYSAFGESDSSGSMWLTAFVLKSFAQSRTFVYIDPLELEETKAWIISQQEVDGSFPPIGRVMNKDIQGGIQGKVSLTAYVVVALLEAGLETTEDERAVTIAQQFLEFNIESVSDPYTAALVAYALTVQNSIFASYAVNILSNLAIRKDGLTYWRLSGEPLDTLPVWMDLVQPKLAVTSAEVEMTAYALLTYTAMGDIAYALPIVKWLTQQRNSLGGFSSTQDTCVALQALSEYATLAYVGHVDLNISLAYSDMTSLVEEYYSLNDDNSQILQVIEIPVLSKTIFLGANGEGCGLMQIDVDYNIPDPTTKPSFKLNVNLIEDEENLGRKRRAVSGEISNVIPNEEYLIEIETCTRWLHAGSSNMAVVEVSLLSGFSAGIESLESVLLDKHSKVKRYELKDRKVILYFDEIPSQCMTCVRFKAFREHAVGKLASVPVKVYDYYEPHFEAIKFYNVSRDSPLSGELCEDDRECNLVEDQAPQLPVVQPQPVPSLEQHFVDLNIEQCNSLGGDCVTPADLTECVCERTCLYGGSRVCGSDGVIYENYCLLEVAACQMNINIRTMPINYCPEPVMSTIQAPSEDGSGSQWPDWLQSNLTMHLINGNQTLDIEEALVNLEINYNETFSGEIVEPGLERDEFAEQIESSQHERIPYVIPPSASPLPGEEVDSGLLGEEMDLEKAFEGEVVSPVNTGSAVNVNATSKQEIIVNNEPNEEILLDTSRLEEEIAALNGTVSLQEVVVNDKNEKVISVKTKAWPDAAKHVHGKLANEVVNHEEETPTETILDHVTRLHDHVTGIKEVVHSDGSKNEVIGEEKVNASYIEQPIPSRRIEANISDGSKNEVLREEKTNTSYTVQAIPSKKAEPNLSDVSGINEPIEVAEHVEANSPQVKGFINKTQEQIIDSSQTDLDHELGLGNSSRPLEINHKEVTETILIEESPQKEEKVVLEKGTTLPTKPPPRSTPEEIKQALATETTEDLGGTTVEPSTALQYENSESPVPTQSTTSVEPTQGILNTSKELTNQSKEGFQPANRLPIKEEGNLKSSNSSIEDNQMMKEIHNVSHQDLEPTSRPDETKLQPFSSPINDIKEDNITSATNSTKHEALEFVDVDKNVHIEDKSASHHLDATDGKNYGEFVTVDNNEENSKLEGEDLHER